jgi:endonuclease/exonuclease/phosphatase family metal-dependent hydrolase
MKFKQLTINVLRWLNILVIIGTILSYLAALVSPQSYWILSLFGLAYPIFLVLNFIFLCLFAALKSRTAILSAACILLGWNYLSVMYASNSPQTAMPENQLKICSYNMQSMNGYYEPQEGAIDDANEEYFQPYKDFFEQTDAAIYCLQENRSGFSYFENFISELMPYSFTGALAIYSKFPIINQGEVILNGTSSNGAIFADLKIDTAIIRLYNVHLQSTGVAPEAQKIADEKELKSESTKRGIRNILERLKPASQERAEQVDVLSKHMAGSPYPMIVCGDFNDTPYSYTYHSVRGNLKDSFLERGNGFGVTYNGPIPTLRIDYILGSPSLNFLSHDVINIKLSDHYPIVAQISY